MVCATDWPKTLRRASFRGVAFYVETDTIKYGRRVKVHEFPHRDRPFIEDLGEKAIGFSVTAYVASDNALSEQAALVRACRRGGPGSLVLPSDGALQVVPYACERVFSKDRLGYIAFSLSFHEAGSGFGVFTAGLLANLVSVAAGGVADYLRQDFLRSYNTVGEVSWVTAAAGQTIKTWLAKVDDARLSLLSSSTAGITAAQQVIGGTAGATKIGRDIAQQYAVDTGEIAKNVATLADLIRDTYDDVPTLVVMGRGVLKIGSGSLDLSREDVSSGIVTKAAEIMTAVREAAATPQIAIEALSSIALFEPETYNSTEALGTTANAERSNELAVGQLFRRLALSELAVAAANADYANRQAAIQMRADVSEMFGRELETASGEAYTALSTIRDRTAQAISRKVADIRPSVTIEANASVPSLIWAYRLYADTPKEEALVARNRVRHPAFFPALFEADTP
jgi:prophage DNA circulation protein